MKNRTYLYSTNKELFKEALSKLKTKKGYDYKLHECVYSAGFKRLVKVNEYLDTIFVRQLTVEL